MSVQLTDEQLIRIGFYCAAAHRLLQDDSYARRFLGRAEDITLEEYATTCAEISTRLIAAGHLAADEDLFDSELRRHPA